MLGCTSSSSSDSSSLSHFLYFSVRLLAMAVKRREAWAVWCVVWGFEQHEFSIISMPHGRREALAMMALVLLLATWTLP